MSELFEQSQGTAVPIRVSAVMPCLNESRTVAVCVRKAIQSFKSMGVSGEVVVVDNGSTDDSADRALEAGARVIHESRRGYGSALRAGFQAARGEIIIMGDCDESYDWGAIELFIHKIEEGFDLVMGNRFRGGIMPGAMPPLHRYLGNPVLSWVARRSFSVPIGDFHCGMRAFTKDAFEQMLLRTPGMELATEMVANAAHQRLRIGEIPIILHPDKRGRPPHLRSFRDGWRHLRFILTYAPDYTFIVPGGVSMLLGFAMQLLLLGGPVSIAGNYIGIHYLALGCLLTLVGFNVFNFGVMAKALLSQRYSRFRSRLARWAHERFSPDIGIAAGVVLMVAGGSIDAALLYQRVTSPASSMESSVHSAFVATSSIVLGANLIVSTLLLNLIVSRAPDT